MEDPDAGQYDPPHRHLIHHDKADAHGQRDKDHDPDLCPPGHALAFHKTFQVVFIQLCLYEPAVKPAGTFPEADGRQHQEGKGRKQGQHGAYGA